MERLPAGPPRTSHSWWATARASGPPSGGPGPLCLGLRLSSLLPSLLGCPKASCLVLPTGKWVRDPPATSFLKSGAQKRTLTGTGRWLGHRLTGPVLVPAVSGDLRPPPQAPSACWGNKVGFQAELLGKGQTLGRPRRGDPRAQPLLLQGASKS